MTTPGPGDAHSPSEMAALARDAGVAKVRQDAAGMFVLGVLGGAFISLGALLYTVVISSSALGFGPTRLLGGMAFSLGLILVAVAGAELFTGNNLVAMAWASRLVGFGEVLRSWAIVYAGNLVGALATAALVRVGQVDAFGRDGVAGTLRGIAEQKLALGVLQAFALAILCNALVCLAIWLTFACRSVTDKVLAIVFPIAAFVAIGFEHCVANMFLLPWYLMVDGYDGALLVGTLRNLLIVTAGNIVGGTLLVAGVYWTVHLRKAR